MLRCFRWPTYWRQELTTWDRQTGRIPLSRWVAIYDVQLRRGHTRPAHEAILEWLRHAEQWPVVPLLCNYFTEPNRTEVARLTRSSTLYKVLRAARRARHPEHTVFFVDSTLDLEAPVGLEITVFVSLTTQTTERDPRTQKSRSVKLRRDNDGRVIDPDAYSVATINSIFAMSMPSQSSVLNPVLSPSPSAFSANSGLTSRAYELGRNGSNQTPIVASALDGGINQAVSSSAGAVTAIADQATATAPDAKNEESNRPGHFVPPPALTEQGKRQRMKQRFGPDWRGHVGLRSACSDCGEPRYARDGESGWCPRCEGMS